MSNALAIGDRVIHPTKTDWGIGQIVAADSQCVTIYFETAKEKKIKIELVNLRKVEGDEAESSALDSKFKARRRARKRKFDDPMYFNEGKGASRKKFIESLGATCANWNWSWSFVNKDEKKIFFGAWQDFYEGNRAKIFSNDWKMRDGKKRPSWPESLENIRRVEEDGYTLHVFKMVVDPDSITEFSKGPRRIGAILKDVTEAGLLKEGDNWYAVFPEENPTI